MTRQPKKTISEVFQWGGKVRIEGPEDAVTEYKEMARKALEG